MKPHTSLKVAGYLWGLAFYAAVIHESFWNDPMTAYARRILSVGEVLLWVAVPIAFLGWAALMMFNARPVETFTDHRDMIAMYQDRFDGRFAKFAKFWWWFNVIPELMLVGLFIGDLSLFTALVLTAILAKQCEYSYRDGMKKLSELMPLVTSDGGINGAAKGLRGSEPSESNPNKESL